MIALSSLVRPAFGMGYQASNNLLFLIFLTNLQLAGLDAGGEYVLLAATFFIARIFDIVPVNYVAAYSMNKPDTFDVLSFSFSAAFLSIILVIVGALISASVLSIDLRPDQPAIVYFLFLLGTTLQGVAVMQASILDAFNLSRERIVCNWLSLVFSAAAGVCIEDSFLALLVYANGLVFFNFAFFSVVLYSNFKEQFRFQLYQFDNLKQLFREFFLPHVGTNTYMIVLDSGSKMLLGASGYGNLYQYELIYKGNMLANVLLQAFVNARFKDWLTHFRQDMVNCLRNITILGLVLFSCANLAVVFYLLIVFEGAPIDVYLLSAVSFGVVSYAIISLWVYLSAFSGDTSRIIFGNASGIAVAVLVLFVFDVSAKYFVAVACGGFVIGVVVRSLVFSRSHN